MPATILLQFSQPGAAPSKTRPRASQARTRASEDPAEKWAKVSLVLFDRQLRRLDQLSRKAHRNGYKSINRA